MSGGNEKLISDIDVPMFKHCIERALQGASYRGCDKGHTAGQHPVRALDEVLFIGIPPHFAE